VSSSKTTQIRKINSSKKYVNRVIMNYDALRVNICMKAIINSKYLQKKLCAIKTSFIWER